MTTKTIKTFLGCCLLFAAPSQIKAEQTCTGISATGGPNYAPAAWLQGNETIGYMPDLIRTIGKRLDIPITIAPGRHWKRVLANVEAGQFDIVMGLLKNNNRMTKFDYTRPVAQEPIIVASRKGHDLRYNGEWASLIEYQGGVILGVSFGSELNTYIATKLEVRKAPDYSSMFKQLKRGRIDYVIASEFALKVNALDAGELKSLNILKPALSTEAIYMAFSKKSPCKHFEPKFSTQIERMKKSGEIDALVQRYKKQRLELPPKQ